MAEQDLLDSNDKFPRPMSQHIIYKTQWGQRRARMALPSIDSGAESCISFSTV